METIEQSWPLSLRAPVPFNHQRLAEISRCAVLGLIWRKRCLSQKDLTLQTKLQASTVSNIIRELKSAGMVEDGAAINAERVGPKETVLEIVPDYGWSIGLALEEQPRMIVINGAGHIISQTDFPLGYTEEKLLEAVKIAVENFRGQKYMDWSRFAGIGVSIPGVVNPELGMVLISRNLNEKSERLQAKMESALQMPVLVERNVICGAYAEHFSGAVQDVESFLYFAISRHRESPPGFGLATVIEERIFRGNNSAAGEVDFLMGNLLSSFSDAANTSEEFYRLCGERLAAIVNLLDINCLVLADTNLTEERLGVLESSMLERLVAVPGREIKLRRSAMQFNGPLFGAALLVLHRKMARDLALPKQEPLAQNGNSRSLAGQ